MLRKERRQKQKGYKFLLVGLLLLSIGLLSQGSFAGSAGGKTPVGLSMQAGKQPVAGNGSTTASSSQGEPVATGSGMVAGLPVAPALSPSLSNLKQPARRVQRHENDNNEQQIRPYNHVDQPDTVVQSSVPPAGSAGVAPLVPNLVNFDGMDYQTAGSGVPPDTNGEVGPNHYVQMVNSAIAVFDKSGTLLAGPVDINQLWSNVGGPCYANNDGDPVVLYDQLANRWVLTQFTASSPYNECIAVSSTPDPTATYYVYSFQLSTTNFPDYPHFGMWPDGYYMGINQFNGGQTYGGPRPYVFDRVRMLAGQSATFQTTSNALGQNEGYLLPSDLDGATPPPAGAPNYFVGSSGTLDVFRFHVDWANPANSTFTNASRLAPAGYTELCPNVRGCIPQPGTTQRLDGLGDRLMYRLAYRNFGNHESLVVNQSVNANNYAGVRWYELRNPGTTPTIFQQGTYALNDGNHRWVGSVAMDRDGDIGMGYSVSGAGVYPSIRITGRDFTDPPGTMGAEYPVLNSNGYQDGAERWGDYSDLTLDPTDDCTFWFTTEYNNSDYLYWSTRISSFKFNDCGTNRSTPTAAVPPTNTPVRTAVPTNTRLPTQTPGGPTATPEPCTIQFTDVPPANSFYAYVRCLACRNIMSGYSCGGPGEPCDGNNNPYFRVGGNITRGQIAKIVANAAGFNEALTGQQFQDVAPSSPFYPFIFRLASRGYMSGYTCGNPGEPCGAGNIPYFRPGANASRGQLSKIVSNAAGFNEGHTDQTFQDVPTSQPFYLWIQRLSSRGYISGYTCGNPGEPCGAGNKPYFRPGNTVSRGQASKIVGNTFFPNCQASFAR